MMSDVSSTSFLMAAAAASSFDVEGGVIVIDATSAHRACVTAGMDADISGDGCDAFMETERYVLIVCKADWTCSNDDAPEGSPPRMSEDDGATRR